MPWIMIFPIIWWQAANALPAVGTLPQHLLKTIHITTSDESESVPNLQQIDI